MVRLPPLSEKFAGRKASSHSRYQWPRSRSYWTESESSLRERANECFEFQRADYEPGGRHWESYQRRAAYVAAIRAGDSAAMERIERENEAASEAILADMVRGLAGVRELTVSSGQTDEQKKQQPAEAAA